MPAPLPRHVPTLGPQVFSACRVISQVSVGLPSHLIQASVQPHPHPHPTTSCALSLLYAPSLPLWSPTLYPSVYVLSAAPTKV